MYMWIYFWVKSELSSIFRLNVFFWLRPIPGFCVITFVRIARNLLILHVVQLINKTFLRSVRRLLVTACVVLSSPIFVTLMKEEPGSSETSVLTRATRRNNPWDTILQGISWYCYLLICMIQKLFLTRSDMLQIFTLFYFARNCLNNSLHYV
jgi:hypothetical protein